MPIYEYGCRKCGHEFEREQRITEDPIKTCPRCKSKQARRLISRTSFVLKGSGWYNDLYSSAKPAKEGAESGSDAKGEGKGEGKSDSKPDSKSESKSDKKKDKKSDGGGKKSAA